MAINPKILRNLGKSVAYSAIDVTAKLAPNTAELARGAKSGFDSTRDFIRTNTTKLRTTNIQYDRTQVSRKARSFLEDAWNDIKQGNLALGNLSDQSFDEWDSFNEESDIVSYSDQSAPEDESSGQRTGARASLTSTDYRTLAGMKQLSTVIGKTQIKTTEFQTQQVTNAIFTQMANQIEHYDKMERQLDSINKNLIELVKFQNQSQSATNQAHLTFYDQMSKYIKKQEERQTRMNRNRTGRASLSQTRTEKFLGDSFFDISAYKKMVKGNFEMSPFGMLMPMMSMVGSMADPGMLNMMFGGRGGKIQPQKILLDGLLRMALPKVARRSIQRGDQNVNTMAKTMLTRLGNLQYKQDGSVKSSVLGLLGSLFGIDANMKRSIRMGGYNRGEMTWNGDAQRALVTVIPKELAEIKAAILKQDTKYYDATTGTYLSEKDIMKRTKDRFRNTTESPFVNIFNSTFSTNPDARANKKYWEGMSDGMQKQISDIVNTAVYGKDGLTEELARSLDAAVGGAMKTMDGTKTDTERMVMTLAKAINQSRSQMASFLQELESTNNAFTQVAMNMTDEYGRIKFDDFMRYIGGSAVNLQEANRSDVYTQSGKRRSEMSDEERAKYDASMHTAEQGAQWFRNLRNHQNPHIAKLGNLANRVYDRYTGASGGGYGGRVSSAIDSGFSAAYEATMMGRNPFGHTGRPVGDAGAAGQPGAASTSATINNNQRPSAVGPQMLALPAPQAPIATGGIITDKKAQQSKTGGIVNAAFQTNEGDNPVQTTAESTEKMAEIVDDSLGKKGYLSRLFNSKGFKHLADVFGNSAFGKKLKSGMNSIGGLFKDLFTKDYTDENGKVVKSVGHNLRDVADKYARMMIGDDAVDTTKDGAALLKENKKSILKSLTDAVRKKAPKILTGGVLGAGIAASTGGHLGLLGSLVMPGGPIGGAIAGMGISILSQTEAFKSMMFGKKNEDGEREGGLISKEASEKFKKQLPTLGKGAAVGIMAKLLGNAATASSVAGAIPSMLMPGGLFGAAIAGSAAAFALKNEKVQDILFGEAGEDGKRTGTILSSAYNKLTGKIKSATKDPKDRKSLAGKIAHHIKSGGIGAIAGATMSHMGLLGGALSFGGPVGAAIAGAALSIASTGDKFNDYLFGQRGDDKKRKKDGLFSRLATMLKLNIAEPMSNWFTHTSEELAWWAREKIEIPFRMAMGPITDSLKDFGKSIADTATGSIKETAKNVAKKVDEKIISPASKFLIGKIIKPLAGVLGGLVKGGLFAGASILGAPFQLLSMLVSPSRRKGEKKFGKFLKGHREENLHNYWDREEEAGRKRGAFKRLGDRMGYTLATLPGIGSFFRNNEMMGGMIDLYGESEEGRGMNTVNWLGAKADRKRYKKNRKAIHKDDKRERKLSALRQAWGKEDKYVSDKELSAKEFKRRTKMLKKFGIDIKDQEELRKFTYKYDEWKNPEAVEPTKAEQQQEVVVNEVTTIREQVTKILTTLGVIADTNQANLDATTGKHLDTDNEKPGTVAEKVDEEMAEDIAQDQAQKFADAVDKNERKKEKRKRRNAKDKKVRGNTSGNAKDEENKIPTPDVPGSENDQRVPDDDDDDDKGKNHSGIGGFLGGLLGKSGLLSAAMIAGIAAVLGNPDLRKKLGDLIGDVVKNAPAGISEFVQDMTGSNGGPGGQRVLETDENGNPTEVVKNDTFIKRAFDTLRHPIQSLKAGKALIRALPGGKLITNIGSKAIKGAKGLFSKLGKAVHSFGKSKLGMKAKQKVAGVAAAGMINGSVTLKKGFDAIKKVLDKFCKSKLGKTSAGKAMQAVGRFFTKIVKAIPDSALAKYADDLAVAVGKMTGKIASNGIPVIGVAVNAALAIYSTINGAVNPENLFKINAKYVDGKMRIISAIMEGLMSVSGAGALVGLISEIVAEYGGFDFVQQLAALIYNAIADDEDDAKLQNAINEFKTETETYNSTHGTNLSVNAYNDLTNKSIIGSMTGGSKKYTDAVASTGLSNRAAFMSGQMQKQLGYGPGLQSDPRWGNQVIGRFPGGRKSTMATGGCGPTALSYAANAVGLGVDPSTVGQFASKNGYITDGGANDGLFDRGASRFGMTTRRVGGSDIQNSLRSGHPVIMAGSSSGYGNDPYTSAGHIVTATGMDGHGNVIVKDPMRGTGKYKMDDLQKSMTGAWSVGRGARGYGLFDSIFGKALHGVVTKAYQAFGVNPEDDDSAEGSTDTPMSATEGLTFGPMTPIKHSDQSKAIWDYLIKQGYSPNAAAGIMGCWHVESNNKSNRVEGDYLGGFPGFEKVLESNESLDQYTVNKLFPAYARSNIGINKKGYLGKDGHYYPGIGLAQWTGPRGYSLFKYAMDNGKDWRQLDTQLAFFNQEILQRGAKGIFNTAKSPEQGAHLVLDNYEMYKGYGAKAPSALSKRQNAARQIYSKFAGGATGYGLLDSIFGGALNTLANSASRSMMMKYGINPDEQNVDVDPATGAPVGDPVGSVDYEYKPKGVVSADQKALVDRMKSVMGRLRYSLQWNEQDPDKGVASCASTVGWAYRKTLGVDGMSAGATTQSKDDRFATIWTNDGRTPLDTSKLQPGDIFYQNWDRTSNNGSMQHAEMYAGNDQTLSHGGNPALGPTFKNLNDYRRDHTMMIRRYKGFMNKDPGATGYGAGFDLNTIGQYTHDDNLATAGYGPGANIQTFTNNHGVETRLDAIIGLMRSLVSSANKVGPATTNNNMTVNYGAGDTKEVKPTVVINQRDDRQLGERDASNEYLRSQYRRLASAEHA